MALARWIPALGLLALAAAPLMPQQKAQHTPCNVPPPPPNCPPAACASPGVQPEWPCGAMDQRRRELERQLEQLAGNIRAVERALQNQHGRAVTAAELEYFDRITLAASFSKAVVTGTGSLALRIAKWAAAELAQSAAIAAASAGVSALIDPMERSALEMMSIDALENLANALAQARFAARQELGALREELKECNDAFNKAHDEWSAKRDAYESCEFKYKEDLAECNRYNRRYHQDCSK
ncbi:MAG: hypothetical protein R2762_20330 [Bryobacteraceae bacterium]